MCFVELLNEIEMISMYDKNENRGGDIMKKTETEYLYSDNNVLVFKDILTQEIRGRREQGEFANWLDKQIRATRVLRNNELIKSISVETRGN